MNAKSQTAQSPQSAPPAIADRCAQRFSELFGTTPILRAWAPGRINLVGGHTDVNGGLALPVAINRWICVCLRPRSDDRFIIEAIDCDERLEGGLSQPPEGMTGWQQLVQGVIQLVDTQHRLPSGFEAVFMGDIPVGAGLSSSAALSVAWITALQSWTGASMDRHAMARMAQQVERDFLGLPSGLLDPIASLFSEPGSVLQVDFRDLRIRHIPATFEGLRWVILHTGVTRCLANTEYADRVRDCAQGLVALHRGYPVRHFRDVRLDMLEFDTSWAPRLRHIVHENARVLRASALLQEGNAAALGPILLESHQSLRDDYEVSCPELNRMVELGAAHTAGLGGRMMGGGFGGCTLHLVQEEYTEQFMHDVITEYEQESSLKAQAFCLEPVAGASSDHPARILARTLGSDPMLGSKPKTQDGGLPRNRRYQ